MVKGKTSSGFEYEIDEEILDDMDFIEDLAEMSSGDLTKAPASAMHLIERFLGVEQKEALKAHLKEIHGRTRFSDFMNEMNEMIDNTPALKNS